MGADSVIGQNKTSAPPSNELADAYIKLREYLVHKPASFLVETAGASETRLTWDLTGKALLGTDGAFYTADIFSRKLDEALEIKEQDLNIYWAAQPGPGAAGRPFSPISLKTAISYQAIDEAKNDGTGITNLQKAKQEYDSKIIDLESTVSAFYTANSTKITFANNVGAFTVNAVTNTSGSVVIPEAKFNFRATGGFTDVPKIEDVDKSITIAIDAAKERLKNETSQTALLGRFVTDVTGKKVEAQEIIKKITPLASSIKTSIAGSSLFNTVTTVPDILHPGVSIYEYSGGNISIDTMTTDYCDAFFNLIDNINLSLAVPFIRINIIDRVSKSRKSEPKMSLVSFLRSPGDSNIDDQIFANARPTFLDAKDLSRRRIMSGKFVGTETFLGPNTLLPDPTDEILNPRRLNPSVPLMSLLSFNTSIESQGAALLSRKRGELSIVVHDRSRLNDVSSMISLGDFSSLYFDIEWGYIHPHGDPSFNNPVGQYLNAMRYREIYAPNTYTMTMGEGGSMTINIGMLAGSYLDATNTSVVTGKYIPRSLATRMLNNYIFNILVQDTTSAASDSVQADVRPITEVLAKQDTVGRYVKREFIEEIIKRTAKEGEIDLRSEATFMQALKVILQKSDEEPYRQTDYLKDLTSNLRLANIGTIGLTTFSAMTAKYGSQVKQEEYASVANILTQCVGVPFAMSSLYKEVQIHVFKFNDSAGKMANRPITEACISINDFIGKPDEQGSLYNTDGVLTALARLCKNLSNPDLLTYGIAALPDPKADKSATTTSSPQTPGSPATDAKAAAAEGGKPSPSEPDPTFTIPNVKYEMRAVPAKIMPSESTRPIDGIPDPESLILQILIYDDNRLATGNDFVKAYNYLSKARGKNLTGRTSLKSDNTLTIDDAKLISKIAYPNMTYGAVNSVIKSLSISTNTRSAIATSATIQTGQELLNDQIKSVTASEIRQIQLIPGIVTLTIFGLPVIERGQSIYLDLGTGTTLDQLYKVTAVRHNLAGDFTTDLTLQFAGQGTLVNTENAIDDFLKTIEQKIESVPTATTPAAPTTSAPTSPPKSSGRIDSRIDPVTGRPLDAL